jgi:hypothetical protein
MLYGILVVGTLCAVWTVLYSAGVFRQRPRAFASAGNLLDRGSFQPSGPGLLPKIVVTRPQPAMSATAASTARVDEEAARLARSARI